MPTEIIVEKLKTDKLLKKSELRVILQIAAVLKGCKESNMLFLTDEELRSLSGKLKKTVLKFFILYSSKNRNLILIYREKELCSYLQQKEVTVFLKRYGYKGEVLRDYLNILKERVKRFYSSNKGFPHEIGVFLGYPICDILGFLNKDGKGFLFSGYWKIYDNLEETKEKFREFDKAKKQAVDEWFAGRQIYEIAC